MWGVGSGRGGGSGATVQLLRASASAALLQIDEHFQLLVSVSVCLRVYVCTSACMYVCVHHSEIGCNSKIHFQLEQQTKGR